MKWIMTQYGTIIRVGAVREFRICYEQDTFNYKIQASLGEDDLTNLFLVKDYDLAQRLYTNLVRMLEEADTNQVYDIQAEIKEFEKEKLKLGTPIEKLDLHPRVYNCLKRVWIDTVDELITMTRDDICGIRNLGFAGCNEIEDALRSMGLQLKNNDND